MKNLSVYFIFFFISGISLAQSKKEMIAILTNRVDSLNQIVVSERSDKQKLNAEISNLKSQIKELESNKQNLSNDKNAIETKNNALNQELKENKILMELLNKQLKIKQDSLMLVTTELLKYRPAPKPVIVVKQDNTGPIKTVTIGRQVWMLENLNVSTFKNGVAIPEVQDKDAWYNAGENKQPAWCYYENDQKNGAKYGKLYNWYAVIDNNGLCPQGWHVPSDAEWKLLTDYLGGEDDAGAKMKAKPVMKKEDKYYKTGGYYDTKFGGWKGTNESGFTGLPGGSRDANVDYSDIGGNGYYNVGNLGCWWSSTENKAPNYAWYRTLHDYPGIVSRNAADIIADGFSVRCLRD